MIICTDLSGLGTFAGKQSGGIEAGEFTGQGVNAAEPVPGTGCLFAPTTIQSCTIGSVTNACEFRFVPGGTLAFRFSSTGDIETLKRISGTQCVDVSGGTGTLPPKLPFNVITSASLAITGGSGKFAGATGTLTETQTAGQILSIDLQDHSFGWFQISYTGTINKP